MSYLSRGWVAFCLLTLANTCLATPPIEAYGELPKTSQMALSPDGKTIAFRRVEDGKDTLMIYAIDKQKLIRAVDASEVLPEGLFFISNSQLVIRTSDHRKLPGFEGSHDVRVAHVLDAKTGQLEQLLRHGDKIYIGQLDVSRIIGVSKDKKFVYMPAIVAKKDSRQIGSSQGPTDNTGYAVMKVELASPKRPAKVSRDHVNAIDYFLDKKGNVLVEERYSQHSNRHEVFVKHGSKWETIYSEKVEPRTLSIVGLTPDYKFLVVLAYSDDDRRQYYTMSLKDGSMSDPGINTSDHDIEHVITDTNRVVQGVRYAGFTPSYQFFDKKLDQRVKQLLEKFSGNAVSIESWSDDWKKLLVYVAGSNFSGEYYLFDEKLKGQFLSDSRPAIQNEMVNPIAMVTVTAQDGLKIPTLLTIPKDKVSAMKNLPAVLLPHGGPRANDKIEFDWIAQALASRGYMVIQPQYRGSSGFGWNFIEAGFGEWGGKMLTDINDVLDFTISKGLVDKDRVCIAGASYGGYAALANGAKTPEKYQCIVSINGIGNMLDLMSKDRHHYGKYHAWIKTLKQYVDTDEADRDAFKAISPYYMADQYQAPVLLVHGENDARVDIEQSKNMHSRLKKAGKDVSFIELEEDNHYLQKNVTRLKTLTAVVDFIDKHLQ